MVRARRLGIAGGTAVSAVVLALLGLVPPTATAATAANAPGDWWYDGESAGGVPAAQAEGLTGAGIRIAVIDGVIDPDLPVFDGADLTVHDSSCGDGISSTSEDPELALHATNVVAYLVGNGTWLDGMPGIHGTAPDASVDFYSIGDTTGDGGAIECSNAGLSGNVLASAIDSAVADGADIISVSIVQQRLTAPVQQALARALNRDVIVVAGTADTQEQASLRVYPAGANGVLGVGQHDEKLALATDQGRVVDSGIADVVAPGVRVQLLGGDGSWSTTGVGTGTSFATPIVAGYLALTAQKYPDASHAQLLQSVIRNTSAIDHPLTYDDTGYGYGIVSLGHLLRVDPTQYDDVNPLITDSELDAPSRQEIADATPAPVPNTPTATASPPASGASPVLPLVIGGGVLALLVIAGAVVAVVLVTRRRRPPAV